MCVCVVPRALLTRRGLIRLEAVATSAALTECPLNFHQAANYFCCVKEGVPLSTKLKFASGSFFLVVLQNDVCGRNSDVECGSSHLRQQWAMRF